MRRNFGMFGGRRGVFWMWVALPPMLVVLVCVARSLLAEHLAKTGREYAGAVQAVPDLERSMEALSRVSDRLSVSIGGEGLSSESFGHMLHSEAARSGLTINGLRAEREGDEGQAVAIKASLKVEGPLVAIVRFLNAVQGSGMLVTVDETRLRLARSDSVPRYDLDAVVRVYRFSM